MAFVADGQTLLDRSDEGIAISSVEKGKESGELRAFVLTLGPDPEILATNEMQDRVYATPAIVDGTIYVRTHSTLVAFRDKEAD